MKAFACLTAIILAILTSFGTASAATSVTLTMLYQFSGVDGSNPEGGLTLGTNGNFYGVTATGGPGGNGTIFTITPEGTLTTLYGFSEGDGADPVEAPAQGSDGNFYGTTQGGGANNDGTVYVITPEGALTTLYNFSAPDGTGPRGPLAEGTNGSFYGTTKAGGTGPCDLGCGTIFSITPAGTLTTLYNFGGSDGQTPDSGLVLGSDANFYGTTYQGGNPKSGYHRTSCDVLGDCAQNPPGTLYQVTSAGSLTTLFDFNGPIGANPADALIQGADGAFYGVTPFGGKSNKGTVYTITSSGVFSLVHSFGGGDDGAFPRTQLVQGSDGKLYGTTINGGTSPSCPEGCGTAFRVTTDGTLTTLYSFPGDPEPALPEGGLVQVSDNSFYGTSFSGGTNNLGAVFQLTVCDFSVDPTTTTVAATGGSDTISMTTSNGCAWTAVSNDGFITITSGNSGSGDGTIGYSIATNTSSLGRIGAIIFFGEPFPVIQLGTSGSGCAYSLSETNVTLPANGGTRTVAVKFDGPGCSWSAVSNDPFITITSGTNYTGNGTVQYTIPGNTNAFPLTGTMTIAGHIVTVDQGPGGCAYTLTPLGATIKAAGESATVKVIPNLSDCAWTAVSNDPFITITGNASGIGRGTVSYTVAANTNTTGLTGTMTIGGLTFTVSQAAPK